MPQSRQMCSFLHAVQPHIQGARAAAREKSCVLLDTKALVCVRVCEEGDLIGGAGRL